jgi:hypothetical protein
MGLREQRPRGRRKSRTAVFPMPISDNHFSQGGEVMAARANVWDIRAMRVLVLGRDIPGENKLADLLAGQGGISSMLSFVGRTRRSARQKFPIGSAVLAAWPDSKPILKPSERCPRRRTHPFAEQIPAPCGDRGRGCKYPAYCFVAPAAWAAQPGDHWIDVADMGRRRPLRSGVNENAFF